MTDEQINIAMLEAENNKCQEILKTNTSYYLEIMEKRDAGIVDTPTHTNIPKETYETCYCLKEKGHNKTCLFYNSDRDFKNRFVQHYPNYFSVEDDDYACLDFNTQEELLNFEYVSKWKKDSYDDIFYRYSLSMPKHKADNIMLMVEYNKGKKWWVIGFLRTTEDLDLPTWIPNED
jgi:hypothetical protein